ncbi:MAG: hypothetical protein ABIR68_09760 [Ilumatobacteraceae bacterium]
MNTRLLAVELGVLVLAYGWAVLRLPEAERPPAAWFSAGVAALAVAPGVAAARGRRALARRAHGAARIATAPISPTSSWPAW